MAPYDHIFTTTRRQTMFAQSLPGKPSTHLLLKAIAVAFFLVFLFLLLPHDAQTRLTHWPTLTHSSSRSPPIPNILHFVTILPNTTTDTTIVDLPFQFSHFLALYAANHHFRPSKIYIHTNLPPSHPTFTRARNGHSGKWSHLILLPSLFPNLQLLNTLPVPTHASNGRELVHPEHQSDFVRVAALHEFGGVYLDWDVHALKDLAPLRESGFQTVAGRQKGGEVNSGVVMAVPGARVIGLWRERMGRVYDGAWTTHSNAVLTQVGEKMVGREMLIVEREAFAPGSWEDVDAVELYGVREGTRSNLDGFKEGMELKGYEEEFGERWEFPERFEKWERDWSCTYLLHAFTPDRWRHRLKIDGFSHITPRYVLERRSNFARAVYPVAKLMYERGLISVEDSHTGR